MRAHSESRIAIDIGGTFTDVVFSDREGRLRTGKVPTVVDDVARGILEAVEKVAAEPDHIDSFVHGTTIALNALLEGKTAARRAHHDKGFRDVLEIMRTNRPDMYDLQQEKPVPLVPRRWRLEIGARMTYTGETLADGGHRRGPRRSAASSRPPEISGRGLPASRVREPCPREGRRDVLLRDPSRRRRSRSRAT